MTFSLEELDRYLASPTDDRPAARYVASFLDPARSFTDEELRRLDRVARLDAPLTRHELHRLLIDLSWASSRLEGNTYTQLDTQSLIEYGAKNAEKTEGEAAMILNHKAAIEALVAAPMIDVRTICDIHAKLSTDVLAPGAHDLLDPTRAGRIRSFTPHGLTIGSTSYVPPQEEDRGLGFVARELDRLVASTLELEHPAERSMFLLTRLPYLQPFEDANKRTSRLMANASLLAGQLAPMSFTQMDQAAYVKAMTAVYELTDTRRAKAVYVDALVSAALRHRRLSEDDRVRIAPQMRKHQVDAALYVLTGQVEGSPFWLRQADPAELEDEMLSPVDRPSSQ